MRRPFRALGRDLYFNFTCGCGNSVKLIGYNDTHFFDTVNASPRECKCDCGRIYEYQWFQDEVHVTAKPTEDNMACPKCEHTMHSFAVPMAWWCPRCGTIKVGDDHTTRRCSTGLLI